MAEPSRRRVVIIEDSPAICDLVTTVLAEDGFEVRSAPDGKTGIALVRTFDPDVVLLDLGLPDIGGLAVCRQLRSFSSAYIIMLTARTDEVDRILGLTAGADDYVTKPFSPRELAARAHAMLRRPRQQRTRAMPRAFGDLVVDPTSRSVSVGGTAISLTRTEFDILDALSSNPRQVFTRRHLIERVWGTDWYGDEHGIDVHISNLRRKIQGAGGGSHVVTLRGVGYRMADTP
jgi:DNA-binding response OmpR family regulator